MAIDKVLIDPAAQTSYTEPSSGLWSFDYNNVGAVKGPTVLSPLISPFPPLGPYVSGGRLRVVSQVYFSGDGLTGGTGTLDAHVEYSIDGVPTWFTANRAISTIFAGESLANINQNIHTFEIDLPGIYNTNNLTVRTTLTHTPGSSPGIRGELFAKILDYFAFTPKPSITVA